MDKTAVVRVERLARHPMYEKVMRLRKKYKVHDEKNSCRAGDKVLIVECRPLSREKRWRLKEILERSAISEVGQ
jgi:small subunit ribosomal protein S17